MGSSQLGAAECTGRTTSRSSNSNSTLRFERALRCEHGIRCEPSRPLATLSVHRTASRSSNSNSNFEGVRQRAKCNVSSGGLVFKARLRSKIFARPSGFEGLLLPLSVAGRPVVLAPLALRARDPQRRTRRQGDLCPARKPSRASSSDCVPASFTAGPDTLPPSVKLADLQAQWGMNLGQKYALDLFFAERHTSGSASSFTPPSRTSGPAKGEMLNSFAAYKLRKKLYIDVMPKHGTPCWVPL